MPRSLNPTLEPQRGDLVATSVNLRPPQRRALVELTERLDCTMTDLIRDAIDLYLRQIEYEPDRSER